MILVFFWMMLVRSLKVLEKMKRMLVVFILMVFFLLLFRLGILMIVFFIIFRRFCCIFFSFILRWNWFFFLELILFILFKNIIFEMMKRNIYNVINILKFVSRVCVDFFLNRYYFYLLFNNYLIKSWRYFLFFLSV